MKNTIANKVPKKQNVSKKLKSKMYITAETKSMNKINKPITPI